MKSARMGRRLLRQSWQLLRQDRELVALPLVGMFLSVGLGALLVWAVYRGWPAASEWRGARVWRMYPIFIVAGFPLTFANAAVVGATCQRLRGEDPTIGSALGAAWERRGRLVVWAVLGGLIGVILQAVLERLKLGGRIAMWTIGLAWQLAITFVIPVLMFEDTTVPGAVRRSASLFKERWGPSVSGQGAIYAALILVTLPVTIVLSILTVVLAAAAPSPVAVGVLVTVWAGVFLAMVGVTTTLDGVFKTVLYHYALTGDGVQPFSADDLAATYKPRTKRHWFRKR